MAEQLKTYYRDYPIDKIVDMEKNKSINVLKFISYNEEIFKEHFINNPIYPGSLILNSILSAIELLVKNSEDFEGFSLMCINKTNFRKPCKPGDLLEICISAVALNNVMEANFVTKSYFSKEVIANGLVSYGR